MGRIAQQERLEAGKVGSGVLRPQPVERAFQDSQGPLIVELRLGRRILCRLVRPPGFRVIGIEGNEVASAARVSARVKSPDGCSGNE